MMDNYKEVMSSGHGQAATHMNLQHLWLYRTSTLASETKLQLMEGSWAGSSTSNQ